MNHLAVELPTGPHEEVYVHTIGRGVENSPPARTTVKAVKNTLANTTLSQEWVETQSLGSLLDEMAV